MTRGTTVKGSVNVDDTLHSTVGGYAWQRCSVLNDASSCQDINSSEGGTTGAWWGSRNADIGQQVRLKATWDAVSGVVASYSALTGVVVPTSVAVPVLDQGLVSSAPKAGTPLHSTFGTWNGYRAGLTTVVFQWKRCSSSDPATCTTNVGANSQWYTPVAGDVGKYLRVTATLTTGGQSVSASTAVSARCSNGGAGSREGEAAKKKAAAARVSRSR